MKLEAGEQVLLRQRPSFETLVARVLLGVASAFASELVFAWTRLIVTDRRVVRASVSGRVGGWSVSYDQIVEAWLDRDVLRLRTVEDGRLRHRHFGPIRRSAGAEAVSLIASRARGQMAAVSVERNVEAIVGPQLQVGERILASLPQLSRGRSGPPCGVVVTNHRVLIIDYAFEGPFRRLSTDPTDPYSSLDTISEQYPRDAVRVTGPTKVTKNSQVFWRITLDTPSGQISPSLGRPWVCDAVALVEVLQASPD